MGRVAPSPCSPAGGCGSRLKRRGTGSCRSRQLDLIGAPRAATILRTVSGPAGCRPGIFEPTMDAPGPAGATPSLCAFAAGWDTAISTESEKDFADLRGQSARPAVPFHLGRPGRTSCLRPLVNDAARRGTIVNEALTTSVQVYGSDVNGVRARSLSIRASLVRELGFAGQRVHCPASVVSCVMLQVAFVAGPSPSSAHSPKPREP